MCSITDNSGTKATKATYPVRIENVSTAMTLETTAVADELKEQPVPLSPGAFAVHNGKAPIFTSDEPERDNGLEEVAEDGIPTRLAKWLAEQNGVSQSGAFTTPVGMDAPTPAPAPLTPGSAYEFEFEAKSGDRLSFVTMFVPSNDLFYSPDEIGIDLFTRGEPIDGDVTDRIGLWDAGTEINEEPGVGGHQPQRQRGPGIDLVERESIVPISEVNGYTYPDATDVLNVTVSPHNG
ncbi:spondin domain-containing protein [Halocatena marina]|uniref:spondin domain-containing protein n=1 Tax=Halocatena marina TaxID=2934937 RepID=UPI0022243C65|nr:spondin domain-containing protein [Halocatena marina]